MANGASKYSSKGSKGSKPSGFKKTGPKLGTSNVETVKPGDPSVQLKNIQQAAAASRGAKPYMPEIITTNTKNYGKQILDNIRQLSTTNPLVGDNPFKRGKGSRKK